MLALAENFINYRHFGVLLSVWVRKLQQSFVVVYYLFTMVYSTPVLLVYFEFLHSKA